ncbi:hypothetical protein STRIP9103_03021 [Streptomyces ipomoeae 91-03]|uniref:Uncharacterized protein n=1 Tax=Streptomyces ipomoeae 91-03 TaxID=698759 RepID=L1L631_9ACTN|nr:hypothetical protein STRIP9103_03021 [Streptomyces ipomoeae 91-03]
MIFSRAATDRPRCSVTAGNRPPSCGKITRGRVDTRTRLPTTRAARDRSPQRPPLVSASGAASAIGFGHFRRPLAQPAEHPLQSRGARASMDPFFGGPSYSAARPRVAPPPHGNARTGPYGSSYEAVPRAPCDPVHIPCKGREFAR